MYPTRAKEAVRLEATSPLAQTIILIAGEDLAKLHGYGSVTSQCRAFWRNLGIKPVPGRRDFYDPRLVRQRLDAAQGLSPKQPTNSTQTTSLVEQRKARKNAH